MLKFALIWETLCCNNFQFKCSQASYNQYAVGRTIGTRAMHLRVRQWGRRQHWAAEGGEPDPNRPGSGYSPLFYATPGEKADAAQYIGSWDLKAEFYRKNGLDVPSQERAMAAAIQDELDRKTHGKVLIGGTATITAVGLSPVALAAARGCLSKPASCDAILGSG